jgi:hypothetical protein
LAQQLVIQDVERRAAAICASEAGQVRLSRKFLLRSSENEANSTLSSLIPTRTFPFKPRHAKLKADDTRHFKRVIQYARPGDYAVGAATAAAGPGLMLLWERISPSLVGKGGFAPIMRLTGVLGAGAGFLMFYQRSICLSSLLVPLTAPAPRNLDGYLTKYLSTILWLFRKFPRARNGYAGNGR